MYREVNYCTSILECGLLCSMLNVITERRNFSEIQKRKCKYCSRHIGSNEPEYLRCSVVRKLSEA